VVIDTPVPIRAAGRLGCCAGRSRAVPMIKAPEVSLEHDQGVRVVDEP
jgi:hypothetical protein